MKWIKLLIIVLSLSLPIHSYACWDDDWDDDDSGWYDDWDDDDDDWWNNDDDDDWDDEIPMKRIIKTHLIIGKIRLGMFLLIMNIFLIGINGRLILSIGNHKMGKIVYQ